MKSRRLLKYVTVAVALLVMGALWAFSFFFFNPFEEEYGFPLATLIPRDVDFFAAKAELASDFDPFPELVCAEALAADPHARAWLEYPWMSDALEALDLETLSAELDASLGQLPLPIDPLAIFGGREVAMAGYFEGAAPEGWHWALYGRANWMGKLAVEALHVGLADLSNQGLDLVPLEYGFQLSGGALPRSIFVRRMRDVVVIATREDLVSRVDELVARRGEESFGLSAQYNNHLAELDLEGDELNVYVDQRALLEGLAVSGAWPDAHGEDLTLAMVGRTLQLGLVREAMGTLSFGNGLTLELSGGFSSEALSPFQKRMYRARGFDRAQVLEAARMVPDDAGLFVYGQGPLGDVLAQVAEAIDDTILELVEDPVRDVWGYPDIGPLLADVATAFGDRVGFFMRDYDYPEDTSANAPLHDDATVAAWAVILTVDNQDAVEGLRGQIGLSPSTFGIRGRDASQSGVFTNKVAGGGEIYEYHSIAVPGTGHLATLEMPGRGGERYFVVSNSHRLLGQAFTTYNREERPLAQDPWFETLVNAGLPSLDMLVWLNPRAMSETTRAVALRSAEQDVALRIDWNVHRPRIEREVVDRHFPGERWGAISPENESAFELRAGEAIDAFEREFVQRELPALRREYERAFDAAELTIGTLLELSLDPKGFELYGRVVVPMDELEAAVAR